MKGKRLKAIYLALFVVILLCPFLILSTTSISPQHTQALKTTSPRSYSSFNSITIDDLITPQGPGSGGGGGGVI